MTSSASLRSVLRAPLAVVLLTGTSTLLLQGCKDETLEARAQAQSTIHQVANEFAAAIDKHLAQQSEASIQTLTSLQSKIDGVRDVSNEQRAAAGILSAAIAQTTAELEFGQALGIGRALQHDRLYVAAAADASATLRSMADANKNVSLASDRTYLQEQKKIGETSLRAAQDSLKQLEAPISELKARLTERKSEMAALQANVEELRRKAIEAGALAGYPFVEKAADEKTKVRDVRASIANDELELGRLDPEQTRANLAHDGSKSVVSAAGVAMDELENFASTLASEAELTSKTSDEYRGLVEARLGEATKRREELKTLYASIEQHLTKAMSGAGNASSARGVVAENAKAAKLSAQATLAAVLADQAANAAADMQMLTALGSAGDIFGGEAKQREAIEMLDKERTELLARAKETLVDAIGQLGEASDADKTATKGLRNSLNAMLANIEGTAAKPAAGPATIGMAVAAPAGEVYRSGAGYASPEEFEASMGGGNAAEATAKFVGAMRATTPTGRAMAEGMATMIKAMDPIVQAATEKWGAEASAALGKSNPIAGGKVTPGTKSATKAEYTMPSAMGGEQAISLVKDGNAWFVDVESMTPGGADAAASEMVSGMIKSMAGVLKEAAPGLAERIRSGAIATPEALQQELGKVIMQAMMGGAAGGMGGGPGKNGGDGERGGTPDQ